MCVTDLIADVFLPIIKRCAGRVTHYVKIWVSERDAGRCTTQDGKLKNKKMKMVIVFDTHAVI